MTAAPKRIRPGFLELARAGDVRGLFNRYADLALAALVVSIVGMMIVPLPTVVLDLLISLNIAIAVTLLLVSLYVSDALRIATFPALLLLTTLFRLALEVSATRLILLHADGGAVIRAFGDFVVAGNLVVGVVIFVILTVIQFIVIAKGAERVAEVAARFTLDAMPGKQMAIDAELRTGHIDHEEASRRRAALARESQLFGSMDGAMKFVKGDAVAGIVVLAINIVGGLTVGILQRGMDPAAAARTYTVLTIGAGLVAQIPALLISTAAGIIVTRVASEDEGSHLGRDIARQILAYPKAIALAAGLLVALALVPGLPMAPFLVLAVVFGFVAYRLHGGHVAADRAASAALPKLSAPVLVPVAVDVGPELTATLALGADGGRFMAALVPALRDRVFADLGLPVPQVQVRGNTVGLPPGGYVVRLREAAMANGQVADGLDAADVIAADLEVVLRRWGHELVGIEDTQALVDALMPVHPALVREVIPKLVAPALLADVLRRLAAEGISLRNLPDILGALAEWAPSERDPAALTEHVRVGLRRYITHKHAPQGGLMAFLLDPMIEDTVRGAIQRRPAGSYLALEPELSGDILRAVAREVSAASAATGDALPVILTSADIRRHVRRLVEVDHPSLAVLSYQELAPEAQIQTVGRISVGG